jgi:peptide deformylase
MSDTLTLEPLRDGVVLLTLRRPEKLNALTWELVQEIVDTLGEITEEEGCLSIPDFVETVTRPERVKVRYLDRNGEQREMWGEGLMARAMCHEIDHLEGTLFVDYLRGFKKERILRRIQKILKGGGW